ncbi:hypothetical protein ONS95_011925 [Cadophora gregata]|uniref:uncharacterized protein n=1 Tax=Cadophora gregata TaxID=51156 RepID=UPI0026DD3D97|nr:uncharacterized protein ONS95_011925 [Cadophora gregata]KAK0117589.1 hypothetical protein ONS95_011925 [Cadophora gregata]
MRFLTALVVLLGASQVQAKAVFAHYMVSNTAEFAIEDWAKDMQLAQQAGIDAFVLNMAAKEETNTYSLSIAFSAARRVSFKLFFSFDYAGNGPWAKNDVIDLIKKYGDFDEYYHYNGKPMVSTFEGPENAPDWADIKAQTGGLFFIPDWSSKGAKGAMQLPNKDGLFSWAAWPYGPNDINTYIDASYREFLNGLPYMMPVSPWFYTNMPGFNKNWMWRGDDLWYDRWEEVMYVQPEFVQIISWNDFGESHYIGPLDSREYVAFGKEFGNSPFNYVENMPHDGWRKFLPYVISMYKNGKGTISKEGLTAWYRLTNGLACDYGGTSGNTASQLQAEYHPSKVAQEKVFYSALLGSDASVSVTIGGTSVGGAWTNKPYGGVGVYHGSVDTKGLTGKVVVTVSRGGAIMTMNGNSITGSCNIENWNAWVGSADGPSISASTALSVADQVCTAGSGAGNFAGLCSFVCSYGYCPIGACYCTAMGAQKTLPKSLGIVGYPVAGLSPSYDGLCAFACNYGYCPKGVCGLTDEPTVIPTSSPFAPDTCTSGYGVGNLAGLCDYSCNFGFCPLGSCVCTTLGPLNEPPAQITSGCALAGVDQKLYKDLCKFTCSRGYCPESVCTKSCGSSAEPSTKGWYDVKCSDGSLSSDLNPGPQRWADAKADDAWADALQAFKNYRSKNPGILGGGFQFSEIIADHVHGTSGRQCINVPNSACDAFVPCDDKSVGGATGVDSPAGYMIINSMAALHNIIDDLDTALKAALQDFTGTANIIAKDFADFSKTTSMKIALDVLGLVIALISAPVWNSWIKKLSNAKDMANSMGTAKDSIAGIVAFSINIAKDTMPANSDIVLGANFQSLGTALVKAMRTMNANTALEIFGGEDLSIIDGLMKGGASAGVYGDSPISMEDQIYKAMVAQMIPIAWNANSDGSPFLMTSEDFGGKGCDGIDPSKVISKDINHASFVCIDGQGYWLLMAFVQSSCDTGNCQPDLALNKVPGVAKLDGSRFGGLSLTDLATSSVNSFKANGNKNGWKIPDPATDTDSMWDIAENGVRAKGMFNVPICSGYEALSNLIDRIGEKKGNWPCN